MTKLEMAVNVVVESVKEEINDFYSDWDIENWADMLDAFGQTSADFKEDVVYILCKYSNENHVDLELNDEYEFVTENGEIVSYRKFSAMIRKKLFKK